MVDGVMGRETMLRPRAFKRLETQSATGYRQLLAAVVQLAVDDACKSPGKNATRPDANAMSAIRFIFGPGLEAYAEWLDFSAEEFRRRLQMIASTAAAGSDSTWPDERRRALRYNIRRTPMHVADEPDDETLEDA